MRARENQRTIARREAETERQTDMLLNQVHNCVHA